MSDLTPPVARYRLTLTIDGNTLDEIQDELHILANGGLHHDSRPPEGERHSWDIHGPRVRSQMEHRNPDMTPEKYDAELIAWANQRRKERTDD